MCAMKSVQAVGTRGRISESQCSVHVAMRYRANYLATTCISMPIIPRQPGQRMLKSCIQIGRKDSEDRRQA